MIRKLNRRYASSRQWLISWCSAACALLCTAWVVAAQPDLKSPPIPKSAAPAAETAPARQEISASDGKTTLIIVVGAPGEEEFGNAFIKWAALWEKAGAQAGAKLTTIGLKPVDGTPDRERLQQTLASETKEGSELWLVLIGHGTFDGKEAKFNL